MSRATRVIHISLLSVFSTGYVKKVFSRSLPVRVVSGIEYCKHMVRLRREGHINGKKIPEIILLNSHDRSSGYQMLPGIFRYVCTNGMVCGNNCGEIHVPYKGDIIGRVIEGDYECQVFLIRPLTIWRKLKVYPLTVMNNIDSGKQL